MRGAFMFLISLKSLKGKFLLLVATVVAAVEKIRNRQSNHKQEKYHHDQPFLLFHAQHLRFIKYGVNNQITTKNKMDFWSSLLYHMQNPSVKCIYRRFRVIIQFNS